MFTVNDNADLWKRFTRNDKGTIAVITALSLIPILAAVGVAVDFSRYSHDLTAMQTALDSGSLSAVTTALADSEREKAAESAFDRNIAFNGIKTGEVTRNFVVANRRVEGHAAKKLPTTFMGMFGYKTMNVAVSNSVSIPPDVSAEIALVLDYSLSMADPLNGATKYVTMRDAAKNLVTGLSESNPKKVKFALVPFSEHVYTTLPGDYVVGGTHGVAWNGCTNDRLYPFNQTGSTPDINNNATKWGQVFSDYWLSSWVNCQAYLDRGLIVAPLSDDFQAINSQLDTMRPLQSTHIAVGAEFGFHVLSEQAPFTEGKTSNDKNLRKIMILLTDGAQTSAAFGPGGARNAIEGEKNLEALCTNIKNSGIIIFTIAFNLDDEDTRNRLLNCSTQPGEGKHFFNAQDSATLITAFEEIRKEITAKVFISG